MKCRKCTWGPTEVSIFWNACHLLGLYRLLNPRQWRQEAETVSSSHIPANRLTSELNQTESSQCPIVSIKWCPTSKNAFTDTGREDLLYETKALKKIRSTRPAQYSGRGKRTVQRVISLSGIILISRKFRVVVRRLEVQPLFALTDSLWTITGVTCLANFECGPFNHNTLRCTSRECCWWANAKRRSRLFPPIASCSLHLGTHFVG